MNLKENIARMEQELADMKKQLEQQDKLELKGGDGWEIYATMPINKFRREKSSSVVKRGAFRATRELAEIADKNMVARNRLEAYVHQIQGDGEGLTYILYNRYMKKYMNGIEYAIHKKIGTVYMQKETAEILCSALNNGKIEL